jgi:sulfur dioxygenase
MLMRQLFDPESSTYSYLLADEVSKQAVLIDSVREQVQRDLKLIDELGLELKYVLETHTHADHVTGAALLRAHSGARTVTASNEVACADLHVQGGDVLLLGDIPIRVLATPGHTDDSVSYLVQGHVFTGDALFIRGTGRTDFQNGNAEALYESITNLLFQLPDETFVLPGHDYHGQTVSTIGEEKRLNPRLAGKSRNEFIDIMNNLHLPNPKKIAEAVPANRACGAA